MATPHAHCCEQPRLPRRAALLGLGAAAALAAGRPRISLAAAPTSARLVVLNVRGGLDGLGTVVPYGDRNLAALRASLIPPAPGTAGGLLDLGGYFGLHPSLAHFSSMFRAGQGLIVHAVGNCATTRSHFEAQDYLQSGAPQLLSSGWLNRVAGLIPAPAGSAETGIAIDTSAPLLMRGPTVVAGWAPEPFTRVSPALVPSLLALTGPDPIVGPSLQVGFNDRGLFQQAQARGPSQPPGLPSLASLAWGAGELLASPTGPRIAALETGSYDTHADQVVRLQVGLATLDATLAALKSSLGAAWSRTVVVTMTEFGRTAAVNGSGGTDHGTAFAMLLAGGAVAGNRVLTQWPGLGAAQLFQGRDLAPTVDYRAVMMGVLQQHLGIPASAMPGIFPGATGVTAMPHLVAGA